MSPIAWNSRLVVTPVSARARCTGTRNCVPSVAVAWTTSAERNSRSRIETTNSAANGRPTLFVRRVRARPSDAISGA